MKEGATIWKRADSKEVYIGRFGGKEGKGEML